VIDDEAIDRVWRAVKKLGRDIPVDYGHESFASPRAEAAGWLVHSSLRKTPKGLYGSVRWTKQAQERLRARKFRYLSPVLLFNPERSKNGQLHIERLVSMGLTNHPNIPDMEPLFNQINTEEKMDELIRKLKQAQELPPETSDAEALDGALQKLENFALLQNSLANFGAAMGLDKETPPDEILATAEKLKNGALPEWMPTQERWQALNEELAAMKQKEVSDMVQNAVASGVLLPAQREWALSYAGSDPEGFKAFLANSKPAVAMGELVAKQQGAPALPVDPLQEKINNMLGITREIFERYNATTS